MYFLCDMILFEFAKAGRKRRLDTAGVHFPFSHSRLLHNSTFPCSSQLHTSTFTGPHFLHFILHSSSLQPSQLHTLFFTTPHFLLHNSTLSPPSQLHTSFFFTTPHYLLLHKSTLSTPPHYRLLRNSTLPSSQLDASCSLTFLLNPWFNLASPCPT
jgi:hypothetical protein